MKARLIAHYLPQFHPIPENDEWWEPGFTEWTNVVKAKPLFPGHHQPNLPADLGFYDLRVPEVREKQAELARMAGIEGFCYWHYWFAGRRILARPFHEVLTSGKPDFPFCLAWANESWQGIWHGCERRLLIEQTYPGDQDIDSHFQCVLPAFQDCRYIRVDDKPLFMVFQPLQLPEPRRFIDRWQFLARQNGFKGIHFVAHVQYDQTGFDWKSCGFEAALAANTLKVFKAGAAQVVRTNLNKRGLVGGLRAVIWLLYFRTLQRLLSWPGAVYRYKDAVQFTIPENPIPSLWYPTAVPNWDNSPRAGKKAVILQGSTPAEYQLHLRSVIESLGNRDREHRIIFLKSWNEWAEGNYLEPDQRFGTRYLDVTRKELLAGQIS